MGVTLPLPQEGEELTGPATEKLASWTMNLACPACISAMYSPTHQALGYRKGQNRRSSIIFGLPNTGLILLSEPQDQGQGTEAKGGRKPSWGPGPTLCHIFLHTGEANHPSDLRSYEFLVFSLIETPAWLEISYGSISHRQQ